VFNKELLKILRCPESGAKLILDKNTLVSIDINSPYKYKIEDGIPIMLIEKAKKLSRKEWEKIIKKTK